MIGIAISTGILKRKSGTAEGYFRSHLFSGLAVVFAEAPQDQRSGPDAQIIKPTWTDLCTVRLLFILSPYPYNVAS